MLERLEINRITLSTRTNKRRKRRISRLPIGFAVAIGRTLTHSDALSLGEFLSGRHRKIYAMRHEQQQKDEGNML
jgi:hypothetical protein